MLKCNPVYFLPIFLPLVEILSQNIGAGRCSYKIGCLHCGSVTIIFISSLCLALASACSVRLSEERSDGLVVILIIPHQVVTATPSSSVRLMVVHHCLVVLTSCRNHLCYEQLSQDIGLCNISGCCHFHAIAVYQISVYELWKCTDFFRLKFTILF